VAGERRGWLPGEPVGVDGEAAGTALEVVVHESCGGVAKYSVSISVDQAGCRTVPRGPNS
jgi:hypothetical protein